MGMLERYRYYIVIIIVSVSILISFFMFGSNVNKKYSQINYDNWEVDWIENFDKAEIDTLTWSVIPRGHYDWNNTMSSNRDCFDLKNGCLVLKGIINDDLSGDSSRYLTGGIYTKFKKSFNPGRFEFRVKLSGARGAWPAIWLRPFKKGTRFPYDGEIDVFERLNKDNYIYQSVHSYFVTKLRRKLPKNQSKADFNPNEFNVFGVDIRKDSVIFHVNGIKTFSYANIDTIADEDQYPFFRIGLF